MKFRTILAAQAQSLLLGTPVQRLEKLVLGERQHLCSLNVKLLALEQVHQLHLLAEGRQQLGFLRFDSTKLNMSRPGHADLLSQALVICLDLLKPLDSVI